MGKATNRPPGMNTSGRGHAAASRMMACWLTITLVPRGDGESAHLNAIGHWLHAASGAGCGKLRNNLCFKNLLWKLRNDLLKKSSLEGCSNSTSYYSGSPCAELGNFFVLQRKVPELEHMLEKLRSLVNQRGKLRN